MYVVVVESPAKAKTINKYLGPNYKVLASFGHIRDLPSKDGSVLPDEDFAMDYQVSADSLKHVKALADAVKGSEGIYLASDPDREGEAISWHVVEVLKKRKILTKDMAIYRISFNEITKRAVLDAVAHPRDIDMDLVNAQQARRALDYLVGFNLSPVLWKKLPGSKSAGRVQSVALRLICEREEEIERFKSQEYWTIHLDLENSAKSAFTASLTMFDNEKLTKFSIEDEAQAKKIEAEVKKHTYNITSLETKEVVRNPRPPFTTSSLQQEAARKLRFSAKKTMMVAQKLYEGIQVDGDTKGLITYMRTDGVTVSKDAIEQCRKVIGAEFGKEYVPTSSREYKTKTKNAQEAHEAIRPTDLTLLPKEVKNALDEDQFKLYQLIWQRMVASQMEKVVLEQASAIITSDDKKIEAKATGSIIKFDGFYKLYQEGHDDKDDENFKQLPPLTQGETCHLEKVDPKQHFTQPPPRFSEASLVKALEELGIGRPSTYASIISVLQERNYVQLEKRRFTPEARGRIVTAFLKGFFSRYVEYDFTANLEEELDDISAGKLEWKKVLANFWQDFITTINAVMAIENPTILQEVERLLDGVIFQEEKEKICPDCEGELGLKLGKFGAFIACHNYPECKYTRQLTDGAQAEGQEGTEGGVLGEDSVTGKAISVKKGPYGHYIQLGEVEEGEAKPKRISVPKNIPVNDITLEIAQGLIALPRELGLHPETNKPVVASIGRYGPYVSHDGTFVSLKGDDDVLSVGMNRAVVLLANKGKGKGGSEPIHFVGNFPNSSDPINVYQGRYGPYIKYKKLNIKVPDTIDPHKVTIEEAVELIDKKQQSKKTKKK